jgi:hypothetical protein
MYQLFRKIGNGCVLGHLDSMVKFPACQSYCLNLGPSQANLIGLCAIISKVYRLGSSSWTNSKNMPISCTFHAHRNRVIS